MKGLSPRTWQLVQKVFPDGSVVVGAILVEQCGQNLPFWSDRDE